MKPVKEKRLHQRVSVEVHVTCEGYGETAFEGIGKDLSVGGMFVETDRVPPFGTQLVLQTDIGKSRVSLPAVVRSTRTGGFGVQFGLLGARETHAITDVIRKGKGL